MLPGLLLIEDFVTENDERLLMEAIEDMDSWSGNGVPPNAELRRRTMQFGFLFEYKSRKVVGKADEIPTVFQGIIDKLMVSCDLIKCRPNHLLINEYNINQGLFYILTGCLELCRILILLICLEILSLVCHY